jgi:hypothetical protein
MGINGLNPKILKKKEMFLRWFCSKDNEKMIFLGLFWYIKKKVATNAASIDGGSGRVSGHGVQSRYRHRLRRTGWHGEWQWLGGSGTNRNIRSARFQWYQLERGSGSIGRDMAVVDRHVDIVRHVKNVAVEVAEWDSGGTMSGSGWVAVVSFERGDQGGSNGTG